MRLVAHQATFAPTDLARFSENPYVTWMERLHLEQPGRVTPDEDSDELRIIAGLGLEHERAFLDRLRADGRQVLTVTDRGPLDERAATTEVALRAGQDVVYQGALAGVPFAGLADFLVRVPHPSDLGHWSYEVWDTKLARKARPYFLVQLCCYAEILESLQGRRPEHVRVITGDGRRRSFRTDDAFYYYRTVKDAFLAQQRTFDPDSPPEPLREGRNGRWETEAARWLEATDHLSLVADIRSDQIAKLRSAGVETREALAELPDGAMVPRLRAGTLAKLRHQARLQVESDDRERPLYEVVRATEDDPRRGLALLP
ncbi:MAG TPA: helicase, partial [bacterium]|nr:helicase [bacterium]